MDKPREDFSKKKHCRAKILGNGSTATGEPAEEQTSPSPLQSARADDGVCFKKLALYKPTMGLPSASTLSYDNHGSLVN
eukprot:CAMPEP_0177441012 /NCGR_PEP_ID=MMETSP0369-20130122/4183_1 /TAXON_ID=447022 ORGANISM="Scrippsiella hangoei-like, Strain SHHI-4" /NCGR_SAMPLE_ID=MMETSP0369 /ASSEMBLY_ACC=CAM_ASM_000364 /LENGTH=78 /DNA_ID=CAMNT_0018912861 /DNA_START=37 /DNA_END=270 /DNA_ORIENTATION=-